MSLFRTNEPVLLWTAGLVITIPLFYKLAQRVFINPYLSSLRDISGPASPSFIWGNMKEVFDAEALVLHEKWLDEYGPVIKYKGLFNLDRVLTLDLRAINHVLAHPMIYEKPEQVRRSLGEVLGQGLLFVEGDQHRQQRRIMSPAFGPAQVRALTEIFVQKSCQLRDIWNAEIEQAESTDGKAKIDVLSWLNKATLDVIGLAGFNYAFNALNADGEENELSVAVRTMVGGGNNRGLFDIIRVFVPWLGFIQTKRSRAAADAQRSMSRIGHQLLAEKKAAVLAAAESKKAGETVEIGRTDIEGRDLMSLLVKANMATDLAENMRMDDTDVLAQVPTFLIAGHETTSTAVTWALLALANHPTVQTKLRKELLSVDTDAPDMEGLSALSYLDAVVREVMRHFSPVPNTVRIANTDDIIPTDVEWTDRKGVKHRDIQMSKGDSVFIPILAVNRSKDLWGEDAREFNPERWQNPPDTIHAIPGIWGNSLAFSGGSRACIGYRFSVIEMKALLYTLVRAFEFGMAVPLEEIRAKAQIVQRPFLKSDMAAGAQLPLWVSPVKRG